jgi:hypothetical protein
MTSTPTRRQPPPSLTAQDQDLQFREDLASGIGTIDGAWPFITALTRLDSRS